MIDLHTHSTFSDGTWTPEELADAGAEAGLSALALTDHDTVDGLPRFEAACRARGLRAVPGVELSAAFEPLPLHILGYFVPPDHRELAEGLRRLRAGRETRNAAILARLNDLGIPLEASAVAAVAGEGAVGRAHIAEALVRGGWVKHPKEAFSRYLARGAAAYVERDRLTPEEAVALLRRVGAAPVIAHPVTLRLSMDHLRALAVRLKACGLIGIEAHYPKHDASKIRRYETLASELGLVITGGTDHHGARTPDLRLGRGFGGLRVPEQAVDQLRAALAAH